MPIGTLVLPDPADVRLGVGYGAGGTEFTGTLVPASPPPVPGPATTPTVVLCQNLATAVYTAWGPAAPSGVDWDFFRRYGDADQVAVPKLRGRQVVFFPTEYDWENGTRANEDYTHRVTCLVVERYTDSAGDAPKDWTAERVDFVHDRIVKGTRYTRGGPAPFNPKLMTLSGHVQVVDVSKISGGGKLFYATVQLEFLELVS